MKRPLPAVLSEYLLQEAARFLSYPRPLRRTKSSNRTVELFDEKLRIIFEWRKTFAPPQVGDTHKVLGDTAILDEFYSREALRAVSGMVDRTRRLASLTLAGLAGDESVVYLREAANCYVLGLPQASMGQARAAVQPALTKRVAKYAGKGVADWDFERLVEYATEKRLLSPHGNTCAQKLWSTASHVLHGHPAERQTALNLFEAARSVMFELTREPATKGRV